MTPQTEDRQEPFWNPGLPLSERVEDLLARMTLEEKVSQMIHEAAAIPRLGIPAYNWWSECIHGVARAGIATVFPQAIGLAASWNTSLLRKTAEAISNEARAKHHEFVRHGDYSEYKGLTYWSPNINIARDPRWGRTQETYGEDPYLTGRLAVAFIQGLQGSHPKYLKLIATPKHYAVHSGPESARHTFDATVSPKDLHETYLPAFKAAMIEGGAASIMGAYNRVNGEPCCASITLMQKILRETWGFKGYFVSDCGAICDFHLNHKITNRPPESAAMAVRHGCDLNCGKVYSNLLLAVAEGLVSEDEINTSLARLLEARMRLGMFDPPERVPYAQIPYEIVDSPAHRQLALEASRESIVLLKNDGGLLPLSKNLRNIAVIGPNADDQHVLLGNYYGTPSQCTTILAGIRHSISAGTKLWYAQGCPVTSKKLLGISQPDTHGFSEAVSAAERADAVILAMGNSPALEGEEGEVADSDGGGDRATLDLPEVQQNLMELIYATGKPIVLVLTGGSAITFNWAAEHIPAIIMAWYPGEEGGRAVADVLFGDYNPAGRLPMTFPKSIEQLPPFDEYCMMGRTYRYMEEEPLFPFGHGLSYSEFRYHKMELSAPRLEPGQSLRVSVAVANASSRDGDEVAQCFLKHEHLSLRTPRWQLVGFERFQLAAGEEKTITMDITSEQLSVIDEDGQIMFMPGEITIAIGGRLPEKDAGQAMAFAKATLCFPAQR